MPDPSMVRFLKKEPPFELSWRVFLGNSEELGQRVSLDAG